MQVNVLEAKTKLTPCYNESTNNRIGVAKGLLKEPDDLDKYNDEIAEQFGDD